MSTAQAARNDGGVVSEKLPVTALCEARSGEAAAAAAGRFFGVSRESDVRGAADGRISHKKRDIIDYFKTSNTEQHLTAYAEYQRDKIDDFEFLFQDHRAVQRKRNDAAADKKRKTHASESVVSHDPHTGRKHRKE